MTSRVLVYAFVASVAAIPASTLAAGVGSEAPVYQGALPAQLLGPRRVAASADGELFAIDAQARLFRLTRRGELVGALLEGATALAASPGIVFAGTRDGAVVEVEPSTARVIARIDLGTSEAPSGLAYDAANDKLWISFASGAVQVRRASGARLGAVALSAGAVSRLAGVAVDGATVWVLQDRSADGATVHAFSAGTGEYLTAVAIPGVKIAGGLTASAGRLYVTDLFSDVVRVVAADGSGAVTVGQPGVGAGQLSAPAGLSFLGNGDLVVANMEANRLDRFGGGAALPVCEGDADCDGLPDAWEIANGLDPNDPRNALRDSDGDGLNDAQELALGTNPRSADTDGDGYSDAVELASGFDPLDGTDHLPKLLASGPASADPGLVRLSASVNDPVGDRTCAARWEQVDGAPVKLRGAKTLSPSFVARKAGTYTFQAVAVCGDASGLPRQLAVTVNNVAPRADGGRLVAVQAGADVRLSGAFSSDANGDAFGFAWDQLVGPPAIGPVAGGQLATALRIPGYYVFRLGATDPQGAEGAAEVPVLVIGDERPATAVVSTPVLAETGGTVVLDGSASYHGRKARFAWQQVDGAAVELAAAGEKASFVAPAPGRYAFELAVVDEDVRSPPARAEVYVAAAGGALPVAKASAPAVVAVGEPVTLDGGASAGARTAVWRQVSGPAAGLSVRDAASVTAVMFDPGSYEFELAVADGPAVGVPARVRIEARQDGAPIPVAVAVAAQPVAKAGDKVTLDGRKSTGALNYRWTQVEGPWITLETNVSRERGDDLRAGSRVPGLAAFHPVVPGLYGFELEVDDGTVRSAPARVNVVVFKHGMENE